MSGAVSVYRIRDFKKEQLPAELMGQFWAGDCFVVRFDFIQGRKQGSVVYFWQGLCAALLCDY